MVLVERKPGRGVCVCACYIRLGTPVGTEVDKVINMIFTLVSHLSARTPPWSRLWLRGWFVSLIRLCLMDGDFWGRGKRSE